MQYSFITVASALVATVSASAISTIADGQPQAPTYASATPSPTPSATYASAVPAKDSTTTEVVTHLTTVCPIGTHTYGSHVVTATAETTVTISDCYCTVAKPVATPAPVSSVPVVSAPAVPSSSAVVSQISDNQPQAPTSAPVASISQIADNQPQAPTSAPAASIPASSAVVSQIADNQPQAPTSAPAASVPASSAVVSQIADNQPQAPTSAPAASIPAASAPAASIPAASVPAVATPTPSPIFTAGASNVAASGFSFAAVLAAIAYVL